MQTEKMISVLLEHCEFIEIAALRNVGRPNEQMVKHAWPGCSDLLAWARFENAKNEANILIRPHPETAHPWLFLDDLPFSRADALSEKYQCIIVETSPTNFQARLLSNRDLDLRERFEVQRVLVKSLGRDADAGSTAGCKFGRLAGFKNRKPGRDFWTNLAALPNQALPKFDPSLILNSLSPLGACAPGGGHAAGTNRASSSESERDFGHILGRLRYFKSMGLDYITESRRLEVELIESSCSRKSNPSDYARRTIAAALSRL